jgi:hypothetical protein
MSNSAARNGLLYLGAAGVVIGWLLVVAWCSTLAL